MNRVVLGKSKPFSNYPTIRRDLADTIELKDYNGLGGITLKKTNEPIVHTFYDTKIAAFPGAFEFKEAQFIGCIIHEDLTNLTTAFINCIFQSSTIVINGNSTNHSVFKNCSFRYCTFVVLHPDAGLYTLFGNCDFVDGIPDDEKALLGDYYEPTVLPFASAFYAWKKVCYRRTGTGKIGEALLKVFVPNTARTVRGIGGEAKIRVSEAIPVAAYSIHRETPEGGMRYEWVMGDEFTTQMYETYELYSGFDDTYVYTLNKEARPRNPFDASITQVCTSGIHCFVSSDRALQYGV